MIYVPSHSQCYRTVSLADIDDDDIDGHAAVLMELLALLAHLVMRPNDGSGWYVMPYDIMESILATIIRQVSCTYKYGSACIRHLNVMTRALKSKAQPTYIQ